MIKVALLVTLLAHHAFTAVRFKVSGLFFFFYLTPISFSYSVIIVCSLPYHYRIHCTLPLQINQRGKTSIAISFRRILMALLQLLVSRISAPSSVLSVARNSLISYCQRFLSGNNSKQVISISLDNETACTPRPTVIMLGNRVLPSSILLHRCRGGCGHSANIRNCTVTKQEELKIKYRLLDGFKHQVITIYNHTGCECDCMIRSSDCKPTTQYYDPNLCSCRCLKGPTPCDSIYQTWHADRCQCVCNKPTFHPCGANLPWNDKICACGCTNKVMQRCKRKGKLLNKTHCQCECPLPRPVCGPNETFLKKNCTCV